jgi:hypothetical protein
MVTKLGLCRGCPGGIDHRKGNRRLLRKRFRPQVITPMPDSLFSFSFSLYICKQYCWNMFLRRCRVRWLYVLCSILELKGYDDDEEIVEEQGMIIQKYRAEVYFLDGLRTSGTKEKTE